MKRKVIYIINHQAYSKPIDIAVEKLNTQEKAAILPTAIFQPVSAACRFA